jgi:hypothetical protein
VHFLKESDFSFFRACFAFFEGFPSFAEQFKAPTGQKSQFACTSPLKSQ